MKRTYAILLAIVVMASIAFADYIVENDSIVVGYGNSSNVAEEEALESTLTDLGFLMYEGGTSASEYVTNGCQLFVAYVNAMSIIGWSTEMSTNGRGYVQTSDHGWRFINNFVGPGYTGGTTLTVSGVDQSHELTTVPNTIPTGWATLGFWTYGYSDDFFGYSTEATPDLATASANGNTHGKALSVKDNGAGRGVYYGWLSYGTSASTEDIDLMENAIIYAAQPPHADAGGPYTDYVGIAVTLDASASTDNGTIDEYEWDIDDDSVYDITTSNATYDYTWTAEYSGDIHVRCTDNLGCKSVSTATVDIGTAVINSTSLGTLKAEFK